MDPDNPIAQGLLKVQFVTKSWPDIQKKLQKLDGWSEGLLCEAQKVYVKREDEKQKQKAKMMVAAVEEGDWDQGITGRIGEDMKDKGQTPGKGGNRQGITIAGKWGILNGNARN
ncbi:hypothetical protein chiPu_0020360 [Chiloscyllium punctatum]|uniref:Core shell protein Gag P30 domain-containing protein n=1 Tax=Chiloscyllium punctatum TaxID=137246 RepID=A0A401RER7_CHIPU|nr:hypothetical protein [Chiloscyllium punctatum]